MSKAIFVRLVLLSLISITSACGMFQGGFKNKDKNTVAVVPAGTEVAVAANTDSDMWSNTSGAETWASDPAPVVYDQGRAAIPLKPGAPERYTVRRGDTLWDISELFLDDPWLWPEIWYVNPEIKNPHLIYPGDVLRLVWIDGKPRIVLERDMAAAALRLSPQVRYESLDEAITTIPYDAIAAFLSRPAALDKDTIRNAPYILDIRESHLIAGSGFHVYVRGTDAPVGTRFEVYHVGSPLHDPATGRFLGYEGLHVGQGRISEIGDPATLFLTETVREALIGDKLILEEPSLPKNFFPSPPEQQIDARIMSVVDGVSLIGTFQIVSINVGAEQGIVPGNVLSVYHTGRIARDKFASNGIMGIFKSRKVKLPDEYAGELMVIRVQDKMSYGLIMHAVREIQVLDTARNPD